jgi:bifunctional UDP-N-acetylglucosamine pyrophosphorylase/glucosamine-1-phosphate N-acetyltransferase
MNKLNTSHIASVILAAGKGKRMNLQETNKVTSLLSGKPIILHIVQFMKRLGIQTNVVVVGYAKESVMNAVAGEQVLFAEQTEQLGTGDALRCAIEALPDEITDVLVVYGDDGVLYNEKSLPVIEKLFHIHRDSQAKLTFLTIEQDNPTGLGRIVRDAGGEVEAIIEEKDASDEQKEIKEINPGCFLFQVDFLKEYLPLVKKSPFTGEYYLTSVIDLAFHHTVPIQTVQGGKLPWRGVNTPEELEEAKKIYAQFS